MKTSPRRLVMLEHNTMSTRSIRVLQGINCHNLRTLNRIFRSIDTFSHRHRDVASSVHCLSAGGDIPSKFTVTTPLYYVNAGTYSPDLIHHCQRWML